MQTTNVKASQLNYDKYTAGKYDQDIVNSIPFHRELHEKIAKFVKTKFSNKIRWDILDLGVGTAITSSIIRDVLPQANFDLVDFSRQMLEGAKKKMGTNKVKYIFGDYSKIDFKKKYDVAVSVVGIHHQNHVGKRKLFKKIFKLLKPGGVFIFGDLVTYKDKREAALNNARHYQHLADKASDEKSLSEWAYHHMFLNDLASVEDQVKWLREAEFKVKVEMLKMNTALIFCQK